MKALTDLVAKVGDDDIERRNEHATAIEQLSQRQMKICAICGQCPAAQIGTGSR
jgi:hypothetical protein